MNNLKYEGYTGVVEFDGESGVLFGRVIGLRDVITFQGDSVAGVIQAFHDSVDVYLEFCEARGESPEKPFSGNFVLRLDPNLHRAISHAAEARGASLNALIEETLRGNFGPSEPKGQEGAAAEFPSGSLMKKKDAGPTSRFRKDNTAKSKGSGGVKPPSGKSSGQSVTIMKKPGGSKSLVPKSNKAGK